MYNVDNREVGIYLKKQIEKMYPSHRQFCRRYLELDGTETSSEALRKMSNRLSQMIKGEKGIQVYDLPIFTELLEVSCEEILSAGKSKVPRSTRLTNYGIAYSQDPTVWKKYLEREDKLFLNSDEYNKTILDYIFEFKNYKFLRYLLDENIIWLVENKGWYGRSFGAGTSIQRRPVHMVDIDVPMQIQESDKIRAQTIALAIENKDTDILDSLHAREVPVLHEVYPNLFRTDLRENYNEDLVRAVAHSNEETLDYFSREFMVEENGLKRQHEYIFPFLGDIVDIMLQEKSSEVELPVRRILNHNRKVYQALFEMAKDVYQSECNSYPGELNDSIKASLIGGTFNYYYLSECKGLVYYFYPIRSKETKYYVSNMITISKRSNSALINELIDESNDYYNKIINMKGEADVQALI